MSHFTFTFVDCSRPKMNIGCGMLEYVIFFWYMLLIGGRYRLLNFWLPFRNYMLSRRLRTTEDGMVINLVCVPTGFVGIRNSGRSFYLISWVKTLILLPGGQQNLANLSPHAISVSHYLPIALFTNESTWVQKRLPSNSSNFS